MTYFPPSETMCSCGCGFDITPATREMFDKLREQFGSALIVSGPARCRNYNTIVTKNPNSTSRHIDGIALDISIKQWDLYSICRLVSLATRLGFKGIGIDKNFVHLDLRDEIAYWRY